MGDAVVGGEDPEGKPNALTDEGTRVDPTTVPLESPEGRGGGNPRFYSRYADQTPALEGQQPPRISGPDPSAQCPHTVLRYDMINKRIYKGREFNGVGNPVRDVDFTNPTYPNGEHRPGHPGPPHRHRYVVNDPAVGPRSGFRRGRAEPIQ